MGNLTLESLDLLPNLFNIRLCAVEFRPGVNAVARFPRNDVNVKVGDRLPRALAACVQKIYAVVPAMLYEMI